MPTETPSLLTRLLGYVARLTGERNRSQLELILGEALCDVADANSVVYYKLQLTPHEKLCWIAVRADKSGVELCDDGINVPQHLVSLSTLLDAEAVMASGQLSIHTTAEIVRVSYPVANYGSAAGLLVLDFRRRPDGLLDKDALPVIELLVTAFRNLMGLLDYSEIDSLTGLLNRKTFDVHLMQILASIGADDDTQLEAINLPKRRQGQSAVTHHWLAVIDIDHFKRINDGFGHLIGDEVLLLLANLMKSAFRFRDKLFRFGGEEFVVVLKPAAAEQALAAFERFRKLIAEHRFPQVEHITVSIGFAPIKIHNQPSVIIDQADEALYWAKENGRNRVASYDTLVAEGKIQAYTPPDSDVELF